MNTGNREIGIEETGTTNLVLEPEGFILDYLVLPLFLGFVRALLRLAHAEGTAYTGTKPRHKEHTYREECM